MILARLLTALIRGPGSEVLRGDLQEAEARRGAGLGHLADVVRSLLAWYRPGEVFRRTRLAAADGEGAEGANPGGTGRGPGWNLHLDLRIGVRSLTRRPGFSLVVAATLALGIGATTTIYSVVDAVLLRPLPYEDAGRLVALGNTFPGREWSDQVSGLQHLAGVSYLNFKEIRNRSRSFVDVAGGEAASVLLPDEGSGPQMVGMIRMTPGFLDLLGVTPALGRGFLPEDFGPEAGQPVILSYGAWVTRFGGDPSIVGTAVRSIGNAYTVVGVLPADFRPPEALVPQTTEFWMPLDPAHPRYEARGRRSLVALGRLRPGVTLEQVRGELRNLGDALASEFPDGNVYPDGTHFGWGANDLRAETVGGAGRILVIFLAAAGLLLLVAVLNATHLFLVRGLDRVGELAVRRALGANQWALARQLLVESLILAALGGLMGVLLAFGGVEAFLRLGPAGMPRMAEVGVDLRVLAITGLLTLGAGLATGVAPAFRFGGGTVADRLASGGNRWASLETSGRRMSLVSLQLAVALVLAVGASLLFESFLRLRSVDPGFRAEGLVTFSMPIKRPGAMEETFWQGWDALLDEVRGVPGVRVGAASNLPFQDPNWAPAIVLPGEAPDTRRTGIAGYVVTPGYLETMGIPLRAGRPLERSDGPDAEMVALVNSAFLREVLGNGDPLGVTVRFRGDDGELSPVRIVGVVGDAVQARAQDGMLPAVYLPYTQLDWPVAQVAVRPSRGAPEDLAPVLRAAARDFSPSVPVLNLSTMEDRMGATRAEPRFQASLLGSFALIAVLLAAVGLYGNLAHMVGRRRRELGIRMALGADRGRILSLVFRQGLFHTAVGFVGGTAGALLTVGILRRFLFGIGPLHLPAFFLALAAMGVVAFTALLVPARRAARVDPVRAFQAE